MKDLQLFNFENQQVRTLEIDGNPYFVGKDVATILGYSDTNQAIRNHVDEEDKLTRKFNGSGQNRSMTIINESGLYSLILSSKMPNAKRFKRWVTSEVLPTIRKHGIYMTDRKAYDITHDQSGTALVDLLQQAANQLKAKDIQIAEMKPKAILADAITTSETSILVGEMAKILKKNGVNTGQNRFFKWLRANGYLIKRKGTDYNMPTQKSMNLKLFEIKERTIVDGNSTRIVKTPKITGDGQQYFTNLFLDEKDA
ncbi:phage antirepressor [Lactobacillus intestinalis]|uniref:phage antirepressor n=1 Tax=Lactobacillus intestinalis TaxID=151781 RepID=UPI00243168F8|nr:phage antirepressor [Lactobacillus intestinalis]